MVDTKNSKVVGEAKCYSIGKHLDPYRAMVPRYLVLNYVEKEIPDMIKDLISNAAGEID